MQFTHQRRTSTPSFVLYQQRLWLLKTNLWPSSESHAKSVYNIKRYFKQFFTFLERTSTFIISLFRAYTEAVALTFLLKKAFCYSYVAYLQRNTHAELLHAYSPVNCLNIRGTPFLKNTSGWLLLCLPAFTCSELK